MCCVTINTISNQDYSSGQTDQCTERSGWLNGRRFTDIKKSITYKLNSLPREVKAAAFVIIATAVVVGIAYGAAMGLVAAVNAGLIAKDGLVNAMVITLWVLVALKATTLAAVIFCD